MTVAWRNTCQTIGFKSAIISVGQFANLINPNSFAWITVCSKGYIALLCFCAFIVNFLDSRISKSIFTNWSNCCVHDGNFKIWTILECCLANWSCCVRNINFCKLCEVYKLNVTYLCVGWRHCNFSDNFISIIGYVATCVCASILAVVISWIECWSCWQTSIMAVHWVCRKVWRTATKCNSKPVVKWSIIVNFSNCRCFGVECTKTNSFNCWTNNNSCCIRAIAKCICTNCHNTVWQINWSYFCVFECKFANVCANTSITKHKFSDVCVSSIEHICRNLCNIICNCNCNTA